MARSEREEPAAGKEYWTARPGNRHGGELGSFHKKKTHRAERRQGNELVQDELEAWHAATHDDGARAPTEDEYKEADL